MTQPAVEAGGWPDLLAVLDDFLEGRADVTETCRRVVAFRNPHSPEQRDVFRAFAAVDSRTGTFPLGDVRGLWSKDALVREDRERHAIEDAHREELRAAALRLRAYALIHRGTHMLPDSITIRAIRQDDYAGWKPLWDGYNAFYGREGATALAPQITHVTWRRFFDPTEPVFALVAESDGRLLGLTHYLFHRSTTRIEPVCYLQDLFTQPEVRGRGVARSLIQAVYAQASLAGARRVYWQTHETNTTARLLYDKVAQYHGFIVYAQDV